MEVRGTSMEEMWGACFAASLPPFLGLERAAVDVDVCPERRWVLLKIPRCDIDGVGEGK